MDRQGRLSLGEVFFTFPIALLIVAMNRDRIKQIGTPKQVFSQRHNSFVAGFMGV